MIREIVITIICAMSSTVYMQAHIISNQTLLLRAEVQGHTQPNISQETHPILYAMVQGLAIRAEVPMPKYISLYSAEYTTIDTTVHQGIFHTSAHSTARTSVREIKAYVDVLGDLHICREILTTLSYEEIEGIIALAIAERVQQKPLKVMVSGLATLGLTLTALYALNKYYNLKLETLWEPRHCYGCENARRVSGERLCLGVALPVVLVTTVHANNLQKSIDHDAARLTTPRTVINGIKGLVRLKDAYGKENVLSRLVEALKLKEMYNLIFYPIRAFTPEERIAYLEHECTSEL